MRTSNTGLGLRVGLVAAALSLGACGEGEPPAPESERPAAVREQPPAAQPQRAAEQKRPAARLDQAASDRERLVVMLSPTFPDADQEQIECLADAILEEMGKERFTQLIALRLLETAGRREPASRTPAAVADFERLETFQEDCGV